MIMRFDDLAIKEIVDDVLVYLKDEGYHIKVEVVKDYKRHIFVGILDYENTPVFWSDMSDDIERVVEVLDGKFRPTTIYYKFISSTGVINNRNNRDLSSWDDFKYIGVKKGLKLCFFSMEFEENN